MVSNNRLCLRGAAQHVLLFLVLVVNFLHALALATGSYVLLTAGYSHSET